MTPDTPLTHAQIDALAHQLRTGEHVPDLRLTTLRIILQYARLEGDLRAAFVPLRS